MELNWSTFLLEILNFLVLVWILTRFLYRPVMNMIEKRHKDIQQTMDNAKQLHADAEKLQKQYEGRLDDWETEKLQARETLQHEIQAEREKRLAQLNEELAAEREKALVIEQRRQAEVQQQYLDNAVKQGMRFATKLLDAVAMPELENKLLELLIQQLSTLPEDTVEDLRKACNAPPDFIEVVSAFALSSEQKQKTESALKQFCDPSITIKFNQDNTLIAGLRINLGSWVLRMNLQDELSGFAELSQEPI